MPLTALGTAFGSYNHNIQQCYRCRTCEGGNEWCRGADYIVDAYKFDCQPCPLGAVCNGHGIRTVNDLDEFGARWEADEFGLYRIRNCPTGYRMENLTGGVAFSEFSELFFSHSLTHLILRFCRLTFCCLFGVSPGNLGRAARGSAHIAMRLQSSKWAKPKHSTYISLLLHSESSRSAR